MLEVWKMFFSSVTMFVDSQGKLTLLHSAKVSKFCNQMYLETTPRFVQIICNQVSNYNYVIAKWEK